MNFRTVTIEAAKPNRFANEREIIRIYGCLYKKVYKKVPIQKSSEKSNSLGLSAKHSSEIRRHHCQMRVLHRLLIKGACGLGQSRIPPPPAQWGRGQRSFQNQEEAVWTTLP